jgi:hypothetical protein
MEVQLNTTPSPEYAGLDFEKVWAMFQETDKQIKETGKQIEETGRQDEGMVDGGGKGGGLLRALRLQCREGPAGKAADEPIGSERALMS